MRNVETGTLEKRIKVAAKKIPADLVVKNGTIVNVFTGEFMSGDIAITEGMIVGIGSYDGVETIDAQNKVIVPGFIDGHVHIESSLLTPKEFSKVVLQHGVTSVVTDPHEIANVAGVDGIQFMLEEAKKLPMDIYVMLSSCVPATAFENNGALLNAEQLEPFLSEPEVLGLAEVMDFFSVKNGDSVMMDKIAMVQEANGFIDGHAAGLTREELNIYLTAGIRTDHESIDAQEAKDRLDLGMYLMIREGTVAKDLTALLPAITAKNARRCLFVTDDKLIDDLLAEGSIDHIVRLAIQKGLDPITAIQMGTLNTAECFNLKHLGAIAPGYQADFLILDDLETVAIDQVYKKGVIISDQGKLNDDLFKSNVEKKLIGADLAKINTQELTTAALAIPLADSLCNVIGIIPNSLVTNHLKENVTVKNDCFVSSTENDQLKIAVIERHNGTNHVGLGIVKGFHLKKGAIATTVAHDSHNIVAVGTSDQEILKAVEQVIKTNGGLAVVAGQEVLASLALPVAGLMTELDYLVVDQNLKELNQAVATIGEELNFNPFLTLSFLTLPVIPKLKLTDLGLFDFEQSAHIPIQVINK
ncbi:adenine deaminase [Carnobacterium sp. 17-4]|uniref:adenine deaminase n=1 Tax=Carnobacterium sp. (strain 17-4) TaxID=208596 RepID=UPI000205846F|nr:adenine deaminase [Carnobacterium sp. 17-4]AEB31160.1 adenine deaminase [Carnobacterium sp. 17-4]